MANRIPILCTRPVDEALIEIAKQKGIDIDVLSFIETEPIENVEVQQEVEAALLLSATIVFTSMNAVEAVADFLFDEQPDWKIYCIGNTTRDLVIKYFGEASLASTAHNALDLAELIIDDYNTDEVIFFCGDQRRDELPNKLRENDIDVNEIMVYQTIKVPHKIKKDYKGILFFSPSAVESFFSVNKIPAEVILFAIGSTTAKEILKYASNKIMIAESPGKEELLGQMMLYFTGES